MMRESVIEFLRLPYAFLMTVSVNWRWETGVATNHWEQQRCSTFAPAPAAGTGGQLEVVVVHTAIPATLVALKTAATLAKGLSARIRLLVPQVVPYPLPLEAPPVPVSFTERKFRTVAEASAVETMVEIVLCRDIDSALDNLLPQRSLVVLGGCRRSWWKGARTSAGRGLARRLRSRGHQVVISDSQ